ncbi:MAG: hypothetical protein KGK08_14115, partial [Acidobacteriota bacterium]|nr:hypothetical protein [Acidobacteriota bacterium]
FVGFGMLLVKSWAWEETKHDTTRKTAMLLAGVTLAALALFAGACWLSSYLNAPQQKAENATPTPARPVGTGSQTTNPTALPTQDAEPIRAYLPASPGLGKAAKARLSDGNQTATRTGIEGSDNTQINDKRPIRGNGNTILGSTDLNGNAIYTTPGAYGSGAHAGPGSIAVGSHAGAGQTAPTYQQDCQGSACAQGPNSQAVFNQYGEPERKINNILVAEIAPILAANPGTASINANTSNDELAQQLFKIFADAGWKPIEIGSMIAGQQLPPGVVVIWRGPAGTPGDRAEIPEDRPDVKGILNVLIRSGVKGITVVPKPDFPEHKIAFEIGGIPK